MKKILFFLLLGSLSFTACKEDDLDPVVSANPTPPTLTAPAANGSIVLLETEANNNLPAWSWSAADFGYDAAVTYTIELDRAGGDFSDPISVFSTNSTSYGELTVGELNNILLTGLDLPADEATPLQVRVAAKVSNELPTVYSAPVTVNFSPYNVVIVYPQLQVPGNYQGWNPADSTTVIYSARSNGKYEGYIYFDDPAPKYKFTDGPSWTTNWGDDGSDGTLQPNGADIAAPSEGLYRLNVDILALTHTAVRTDWGLIGSATPTGWDSDTDMTYDPARNILTITIDLVPGDIKFRANDAWDIDLGDDGLNKKLEYGGANIPIAEAGNYTIELDLSKAIYTYKVIKN